MAFEAEEYSAAIENRNRRMMRGIQMNRAPRFVGPMLVLALGIMAIGTNLVSAETGAFWRVNGTSINGTLKPQVQVSEIEELEIELEPGKKTKFGKVVILLSKTGLTKVEVTCPVMKLVDALLGLTGSATGKFHFSGCTTKLKEVAAPKCQPHSPGSVDGLIETNALTALIVLHEGKTIDLLELKPASGTVFTTIVFGNEVGSECSIKKFDITGKFFLKAKTNGEALEELVTHLFREGPLSALLFGGNAATIHGSALAVLMEPHAGLTWSEQPG